MEKTKLIEIRVKSHVLKVIRIQSGEEVNGEPPWAAQLCSARFDIRR